MGFFMVMVLPSVQTAPLSVGATGEHFSVNLRNAMLIPVKLIQMDITEPLMVHHMITKELVNMY